MPENTPRQPVAERTQADVPLRRDLPEAAAQDAARSGESNPQRLIALAEVALVQRKQA